MKLPKTKCAICNQDIVDGKDQALLCKGTCKSWFHRYCAGVSITHFEKLSASTKPFHCVSCFQEKYVEELEQLRTYVGTLKDEISQLHTALSE